MRVCVCVCVQHFHISDQREKPVNKPHIALVNERDIRTLKCAIS